MFSRSRTHLCLCFLSSRFHGEALRVSAPPLLSAAVWGIRLAALPAVWLLSTGGAGELDSGGLRGEGGGSDQR